MKPTSSDADWVLRADLTLTLFPRDGYRSVLSKLAGGTARLAARGQRVSSSALWQRRLSLGPEPFRLLFERIAGPVGTATMPGVFWRGLRLARWTAPISRSPTLW